MQSKFNFIKSINSIILFIKKKFKAFIIFTMNLLGLKIIKLVNYKLIQQYLEKSQFYYSYYLRNNMDLSSSEMLQLLELEFGGATFSNSESLRFASALGGDRFSVFYHSYSYDYSKYLDKIRFSKLKLNILEVGILNGSGLAVWDRFFINKELFGFDYDLSNFERNKINLLNLGAFNEKMPTIKYYDQFADNSKTLFETFGKDLKLDVIIDDAYHTDEAIINTFIELKPFFNNKFVYFIEDNKSAWKKLMKQFPEYNYDYNGNELTVITSIID